MDPVWIAVAFILGFAVHAAFNFFEGAGAGFAGHVAERLEGSDRN